MFFCCIHLIAEVSLLVFICCWQRSSVSVFCQKVATNDVGSSKRTKLATLTLDDLLAEKKQRDQLQMEVIQLHDFDSINPFIFLCFLTLFVQVTCAVYAYLLKHCHADSFTSFVSVKLCARPHVANS